MQIIPHGITLTMDQDGRASGDAYVEFATNQDVDSALKKHKEKMGHRWGMRKNSRFSLVGYFMKRSNWFYFFNLYLFFFISGLHN